MAAELAGTSGSIRRAKLMPPRLGTGLVPRPRLIRRLELAVDQPVILVVGPAGFGKTTLLAEWLSRSRTASAWLAVDAADDGDLGRLVRHLCATIQRTYPEIGGETLGHLDQLNWSPAALGMALADELLDLPDDLILVIDDFQELASAEVAEFFTAFLHYPPELLRLVICSRSDPKLPLGRLRGQGLVAELRAADLRFTWEETRDLFRWTSQGEPDAEAVSLIHERTEGWVAGLRLAAMVGGGRDDAPSLVEALSTQGQRNVMDFLIEEVLSRQSPEIQEFLLRMSIVDRFSAPLADKLLSGPSRLGTCVDMLDQVARANLYLEPVGQDGVWYRYHPLFRELLRHRLELTIGEVGLDDLHRRAAAWFADNGHIDEAIRHLLAAGRGAQAGRLVERRVHATLDAERWPDLDRWLRLLGDDLVRQRPALLVASAWTRCLSGGVVALRALVGEGEALLAAGDRPPDEPHVVGLRAELEVLRSTMRLGDEPDEAAVATLRAAFFALPEDHRYVRGFVLPQLARDLQIAGRSAEAVTMLRGVLDESSLRPDVLAGRALLGIAYVHLRDGHLRRCEAVSRQLLQLATDAGLDESAAWGHLHLGVVALEWDQLDRAAEHFGAVLALNERAQRLVIRESTFGLALTHLAGGRADEAVATVDRLLESLLATGNTEFLPAATAARARCALNRGDHLEVGRWLESFDAAADRDPLHRATAVPLTRVRALIAEGSGASIEAARDLLDALLDRAERGHCALRLVEIHALRALALAAAGEREPALAALAEALRRGEPDRFTRSLVDLGPPLAGLLATHVGRHGRSAYLDHLLARLERTTSTPPAADVVAPTPADSLDRLVSRAPHPTMYGSTLLERLTDRELEVLGGLQRRLSNKEIADILFISPLTVKRHASNIYDKLGVANRRQAILKASELGVEWSDLGPASSGRSLRLHPF